ncbi:MAG: copper-binding protein [Thermoanaerobaculia bacterium]
MKAALVIITLALVACQKPASQQSATGTAANEKTYVMNGKLVARDASKKEVTIENEEVPGGVMPAMTMPYEYRSDFSTLPADGTKITSTLHEQNDKYWVTDVKPAK